MSVAVTITGTGNSSNCYVTIGGTKYSAAANTTVNAGDTITFLVKGRNSSYAGKVTIDGATVLSVTSNTTSTYNWVVPDGLQSVSIFLSYSSSFYVYGTITVTTKVAPKTHRTLVDATGYGVEQGWCLVDATRYDLQKGRTLVDGTGYDLNFESGALYLEEVRWGNATFETTVSDTEIVAYVKGLDSNYAGTEFRVFKNGEPYLLPAGTEVVFSFTRIGSGSSEGCIRFCTDIEDNYNSLLQRYMSNCTDQVYTVTTPCYALFLSQAANSSASCKLTITKLTIDGVPVWVK
jgi:hypothetical protein